MLSVVAFWAKARWGDEWGVRRIVNGVLTNPHRGHDGRAAPGEAVPALRAGRVAMVSDITKSSIVGYHVVLLTPGGEYDYYCHLRVGTRPNLGDWINVGDSVGLVAGWNDFHGSAWTGPHVHFGSGPSIRSVYEGTTYNATQIVKGVLARLSTTAPAADDIKEIIMALTQEDADKVGETLAAWPIAKDAAGKDIPAWRVWRETHREVNQELSRPSAKSALTKLKDTVAGNARNAVAILADLHPKVVEILAVVKGLADRQEAAQVPPSDEQVQAALDARLDALADLVVEKWVERVSNGPAARL